MTEEKIARINELARKSKTVGLSDEEKTEQAILRREFIDAVKQNVRAQMDNIDVEQADGTVVNAGEAHRAKYGE